MNAQPSANDMIDYLRREILPGLARLMAVLTTEDLWEFRSRLHALHHYCLQSGLPDDLSAHVEAILSTSAGLWNLLSENEISSLDLKDYIKGRTFSAEAEGLTNFEEWISGEDTLRDVIINSFAFMLNWKSNTIWVDSVKRARRAMAKNYTLELQDGIWQFIKESAHRNGELSLERANQIRQRTNGFMRLIREENLTTEAQIALLMQIYTMLLRLQLGKLILRLEEIRGDSSENDA